jgi:hypothetical protein
MADKGLEEVPEGMFQSIQDKAAVSSQSRRLHVAALSSEQRLCELFADF